jgi:hypothetical protein
MKWCLLHIVLLSVLILPGKPWSTNADDKGVQTSGNYERYSYEALSTGSGYGTHRESIQMEISATDYRSLIIVQTNRKDSLEIVEISTDHRGRFLSGTREIYRARTKKTRTDRIWQDKRTVSVVRWAGERRKIRKLQIPEGMPLAVDASLLYLLRSFPFNTEAEWKIFMVDFLGYFVQITARHTGTETVTVPAGEFECYRIEATVNLPIFQSKILFWLAETEPHLLVKHTGKRGPLTPTYRTTLTSIE